ncbi:MAG: hypothetical protein ACXU9D_18325, partial [Xanthobacteraceae bacterium]
SRIVAMGRHPKPSTTASVERSRHVGFTPDSGRMAATQLTDGSGQCTKSLRDSLRRWAAHLNAS